MKTVTKEFTYYDDGCFPTVHAVGEEVTGEVETYAVAQGFAADKATVVLLFSCKHKGGGKWEVNGPDGVVGSDLTKEAAKIEVDRLNEVKE